MRGCERQVLIEEAVSCKRLQKRNRRELRHGALSGVELPKVRISSLVPVVAVSAF